MMVEAETETENQEERSELYVCVSFVNTKIFEDIQDEVDIYIYIYIYITYITIYNNTAWKKSYSFQLNCVAKRSKKKKNKK